MTQLSSPLSAVLCLLNGRQLQGEVSQHSHTQRSTHTSLSTHTLMLRRHKQNSKTNFSSDRIISLHSHWHCLVSIPEHSPFVFCVHMCAYSCVYVSGYTCFLYGKGIVFVVCTCMCFVMCFIYPVTSHPFSNTLLLSHQSLPQQRLGCRQSPCSVPAAMWM